jgi:hypothetical protein
MAYADELVIRQLSAKKCRTEGSIEEGIIVREKKIEFEQNELFSGKIKVMLPADFSDMPPEAAKQKYPMEQRPAIIKTSPEMDMDFAFNIVEQPIANEQIEQVADYIRNVMKKVQTSNVFCEKGTMEAGKTKIAWFDFISNGIDEKMYNFMYFFCVDGKLCNGVFNCAMKKTENWKSIVLEVLKTLVVA